MAVEISVQLVEGAYFGFAPVVPSGQGKGIAG